MRNPRLTRLLITPLILLLLSAFVDGCANHPADLVSTTSVVQDGITYNFPAQGLPTVSRQNGAMDIVTGHDDIRNLNGKLIVNGMPYGRIRSGDIIEWHANRTITINGVPQDNAHLRDRFRAPQ